MARTVARSARTGRFVSSRAAAANPRGTIRQTVGGKARGSRSAISGRFVTTAWARRSPGTTVTHDG